LRFSEEQIEKLLELKWWNWTEADLRKAQAWFAQDDIKAFLDWAGARAQQANIT
jgi:chloramphenicol O-acetyltransferase type B